MVDITKILGEKARNKKTQLYYMMKYGQIRHCTKFRL